MVGEAILINPSFCISPKKIIYEVFLKKNSLISNVTSSSVEPISLEIPEERMTDEEFKKVMQALEEIWSVCPENLPEDLSTRHDYYLK